MEQDPHEGTGVKAGRRVTLFLSKGAVKDKVGEYIGKNLEQVREELRSTFGADNPLIDIGSVSYTFDQNPVGSILSQDPLPGTQLSGQIHLSLLVSKGWDQTSLKIPSFVGLPYQRAMDELANQGLPFIIALIQGTPQSMPGTIISQDPTPNTNLSKDGKIILSMVAPANVPSGNVFGVYQKNFPPYAVPVDLTIQVSDPQGGNQVLYTFKTLGGDISFPYLVPSGSDIVLVTFGKELDRLTIGKKIN